jgi:hypothetical protein
VFRLQPTGEFVPAKEQQRPDAAARRGGMAASPAGDVPESSFRKSVSTASSA